MAASSPSMGDRPEPTLVGSGSARGAALAWADRTGRRGVFAQAARRARPYRSSMTWRFLLRSLAAVATATVVVSIGLLGAAPAGAGTDPVTGLRSGTHCEVETRADGFEVRWVVDESGDAVGVDRVVIERRVSGTFWWRGRVDPEVGVFVDGPAPRWTARVDYRVVAKDAAGTTLTTADCDLVTSTVPGAEVERPVSCVAARTADGYRVELDDPAGVAAFGDDVDLVVRRSARAGGPFHWRARTDATSIVDASAEMPEVVYQLWIRDDRRIVAAAMCRNHVTADACVTPIAEPPATRSPWSDAEVDDALLEQIDPDRRLMFLAVGADGRIAYVVDDEGRSDLWLFTPADDTNVEIASDIGAAGTVAPMHVDPSGTVYVITVNIPSNEAWLHRPGGEVVTLVGASADPHTEVELVGVLDDGRMVFQHLAWTIDPDDSLAVAWRPLVWSSAAGALEPLEVLEQSRVLGVSLDGDLVVEHPYSIDPYFVLSADCV